MKPQEVAELISDLERIAWTSADWEAFWDLMIEYPRVQEILDKHTEDRVQAQVDMAYDEGLQQGEANMKDEQDVSYREGVSEGRRGLQKEIDAARK